MRVHVRARVRVVRASAWRVGVCVYGACACEAERASVQEWVEALLRVSRKQCARQPPARPGASSRGCRGLRWAPPHARSKDPPLARARACV